MKTKYWVIYLIVGLVIGIGMLGEGCGFGDFITAVLIGPVILFVLFVYLLSGRL